MKYIFNTKIVNDVKRNGQEIKILQEKGCQVLVEFPDGEKLWAYKSEIDEN